LACASSNGSIDSGSPKPAAQINASSRSPRRQHQHRRRRE
jgi:hypothetical protein